VIKYAVIKDVVIKDAVMQRCGDKRPKATQVCSTKQQSEKPEAKT
jgi:hypothetical protein